MAIYGLETKSAEINDIIKQKEDRSLVPLYESENVDSLVRAFIDGYKWPVTYFHRVIDDMDQITEYDPELDPTLQNYVRINNLTLYLQSPLPEGTGDNLAGEAIIDLDIIPNPNDLFIARLLGGKIVMFSIEDVQRINYNNDNLFSVSFKNYGEYDSEDDPLIVSLMRSTTEELTYNEKYRIDSTQPLYTPDDLNLKKDILFKIDSLINLLNTKFVNRKTQFFYGYIDKDSKLIYDPHMYKFIKKAIGFMYFKKVPERVDITDNESVILDYMLDLTISKILIAENVRLSVFGDNNNLIKTSPYLDNTMFTLIDKVVDIVEEEVSYKDNGNINELYPYLPTGKYIFRKEIYDVILRDKIIDKDKLTLFETIFLSFINRVPIEYDDLELLYTNINKLPNAELFYYVPILITILNWYVTTFSVPFI